MYSVRCQSQRFLAATEVAAGRTYKIKVLELAVLLLLLGAALGCRNDDDDATVAATDEDVEVDTGPEAVDELEAKARLMLPGA
jgi:hypothetical protein